MSKIGRPLRLSLDGNALEQNWRTLAKLSGAAATGAAVKADGYGLSAREVTARLSAAGCRDFFVANWNEAAAISDIVPPASIAVLNGVSGDDIAAAFAIGAVPVLNTPGQLQRWKAANGGRCHVMLDSGINRLGIGPEQLSPDMLDGLEIDIALSHLASADQDVGQNAEQLQRYRQMLGSLSCARRSFANSAGIALGQEYAFDLTRPGISLYGGVARPELSGAIKPVARIFAQILQIRSLTAGMAVGYEATYICPQQMTVATIALGYADGYLRGFSGRGRCFAGGDILPVIGRVSMDLVTIDISASAALAEGDWVEVDYDLNDAARASGLSPYELLTGLGDRFDRSWL